MVPPEIGSIDALVLCGGQGSRLKDIVPDRPKILAEIAGYPFAHYLLVYLEKEGLKRVILCTGYKHDKISEWISSSYNGNLDIVLSKEEVSLGTGGAIKNAQDLIYSNNFLVINGDTFTEINYYKFVKYYSFE